MPKIHARSVLHALEDNAMSMKQNKGKESYMVGSSVFATALRTSG